MNALKAYVIGEARKRFANYVCKVLELGVMWVLAHVPFHLGGH